MTNQADKPSDREAEEAAWDAEMTAKDPRFPARKAASLALDKYVREWIDGYELDDGEVNHAPTELESFLIHDAFAGLSEDEEYLRLRAAWKALCGPAERLACQSAAAPPSALLLEVLEALKRSNEWLATYPAGGTMSVTGPYEQSRAAIAKLRELMGEKG